MLLTLAFRNIWRNTGRSIVIMLSVGIGLMAGIAVIALYKGMMRSRVKTVIEAETGHIQLHHPDFKKDYEVNRVLANGSQTLQMIRSMENVRLVAPRSITQGMLSNVTGSTGVEINGIDPQQEYRVSHLKEKIKEGKGFTEGKKNEILIGKKLAGKMKLKPGVKLVLTFTDTAENIVAGAFRVAGIYESDNARLDEKNVYVQMRDLNGLLGIGESFHEITIILNKDQEVNRVHNALQKQFPACLVETWAVISPETQLMINTVDEYAYIIIVIIMLALAFGIINTMLMAILERTKEIGMMTALGMDRFRLFALILLETLILTLAGSPVGFFISWVLITHYNKTGLDLSVFGKEMLSSFGYSSVVYPEFPWDRLIAILIIVSATALFSCLFPAAKALRLQPVKALQR